MEWICDIIFAKYVKKIEFIHKFISFPEATALFCS